MHTEEAKAILEQHQLWRRGLPPYDETGGMPYTPEDVGVAIDVAIKALEGARMTYLESTLETARDVITLWTYDGQLDLKIAEAIHAAEVRGYNQGIDDAVNRLMNNHSLRLGNNHDKS